MDPQIIVALVGLVGVLGGVWVSNKGRKAEAQQKELAEQAAEEHQRFKELESTVAAQHHEVDRAYAARDSARVEAERERGRRVDAETAADLAVERARRQTAAALSDLESLRAVVVDEISKEATRTAVEMRKAEPPPERAQEAP